MKILLEVKDKKGEYALEFLKHISFIKKVEIIAKNQITNLTILESIERYETSKKKKNVSKF